MARISGKFIEVHKETWTTVATRVFTHNLGTSDVVVTLRNLTTNEISLADSLVATTDNTVTITVSELPPAGIRVIIQGF